jgi:hypothetical protein
MPQKKRKKTNTLAENKKRQIPWLYIITIILAAIPFILGKYIEFNSPGAFDSGAYVYSAKHILEGAVIGVDEIPTARIGTLFMNIAGVALFGYSDTGPKIIQTILQVAAIAVMFISIKKVFSSLPAALAAIVASIYLNAPVIAKFGNVKEQYMITFMVIGVSLFLLFYKYKKWYLAVISGFFLAGGPLFKETGLSAPFAVGLFIIITPLIKNTTFKIAAKNAFLVLAGAIILIAPISIWIETANIKIAKPYSFVFNRIKKVITQPAPKQNKQTNEQTQNVNNDQNKDQPKGYVARSRSIFGLSKQTPIVLSYYKILILPITLALISIIAWVARLILCRRKKIDYQKKETLVLMLAIWWLTDMLLVWVSPRSYEQYYLPLNASAAMLGSYIAFLFQQKFRPKNSPVQKKTAIAAFALITMIIMSWHIFFGISKSPHSQTIYKDPRTGQPEKRRGYLQKLKQANAHRKGQIGSWEIAGKYIKQRTSPDDKIYVWGWYPGIYVKAKRLSPVPEAFEANMHIMPPKELEKTARYLVNGFKKNPPEFIVDTHKRHFPWNRPPLELWPVIPEGFMGAKKKGFLPKRKQVIQIYEKTWAKFLEKRIGEKEDERFNAMKPLRDYIMNNYKIANVIGPFVIFEKLPAG